MPLGKSVECGDIGKDDGTKAGDSAEVEKINLSVVTATYNERENILILITELNRIFQENGILGEVVVVDDSSPDGTSDVVLEMKRKFPNTVLVKRPGRLGIGSAYKDGIKASRGEVVTLMDADFSQPPSSLAEMYKVTRQGKIGWGSRYYNNVKFESDLAHRIGTKLLNKWISLWLRTEINDHTLGYFAIRREHLDKIMECAARKKIYPFSNILYGLPIAAVAFKLGLTIVEVDAPYQERKFGESKIGFFSGVSVVGHDMIYTLALHARLRR